MEKIEYAKSFLGIPYRWWDPAMSCCETTGPFWAEPGAEVPLELVRVGLMCCAGLLNLICRRFGLPIPGSLERHVWAGGTGLWWEYFEENGMAQPYEEGKVYPAGTILMRAFRKEREDEGHIAIATGDGQIIHSWPEKGVVIEPPEAGFYEVAVVGFL
jgi:hypothetical protein